MGETLISAEGPEFEVMCLAARVHFTEQQALRIKQLIRDGIDWSTFLARLQRHYVAPLVYRNLASIEQSDVPAKVLETMRVRTLITAWRCLEYATELERLTQLFEANSIDVIHYKGAVAAQQLYGDVTLRNFSDLDFLVRRAELGQLIDVLEADGYENVDRVSAEQMVHFVAEFKELLFRRGEFALEPHWSLTMRRYPFEPDYDGFWRRSQRLPFKSVELRVLGPEDALLVLCVVGAKARWERLQMVCDVAECLRTFPELDWAVVERAARQTGTVRILHLGLRLAAELLGAQLPADQASAIASRPVTRLARDVVAAMNHPLADSRFFPPFPQTFSAMLFRQRERWRDRWRYLWRTFTTPSMVHLERMPLPKVLHPLYWLLVPLHDYVAFPLWRLIESLTGRLRPESP